MRLGINDERCRTGSVPPQQATLAAMAAFDRAIQARAHVEERTDVLAPAQNLTAPLCASQVGATEPCRLYLQMCQGQSVLAQVLTARGMAEDAVVPDTAAGRCMAALAGLASCKDFMHGVLMHEQELQGKSVP